MKAALSFLIAISGIQAHADVTSLACSYKPTASLAEALPMNPNSVYLDVESPRNSFLLFASVTSATGFEAAAQSLAQDAQARITVAGIKTGSVFVFARAADAQASVQVNSIVDGLVVLAPATPVDFTGVAPVNGQSVVTLPNGISCAYGDYVAPAKVSRKRR